MTSQQRETRRSRNHPVGQRLLGKARTSETIYPDQIDDLRLPPRQRAAFADARQRIERERSGYRDTEGNPAPLHNDPAERYNQAERYARAIIDTLPPEWEDQKTYNRR